MLRWRGLVVLALASCVGRNDAPEGATTGAEGSTSGGEVIDLDQCDELLTQSECEAAGTSDFGDGCVWFDVRIPGPSCSSDTVAARCVGMTYVGAGCQAFGCPDSEYVDGFYRDVDGQIEVFANPPTRCGLIATRDGWMACQGPDMPIECSCLCAM